MEIKAAFTRRRRRNHSPPTFAKWRLAGSLAQLGSTPVLLPPSKGRGSRWVCGCDQNERECVRTESMSAGGNFPPLHEVLPPKCLEPERLNSSNSGFPFSELAGWKVHDSGESRTIGFYLSSVPHWHHFLLFPFLGGGNGTWPRERNNSQGSCTESLLAARVILGEKSRGSLTLPEASTHHLPDAHTLSLV